MSKDAKRQREIINRVRQLESFRIGELEAALREIEAITNGAICEVRLNGFEQTVDSMYEALWEARRAARTTKP